MYYFLLLFSFVFIIGCSTNEHLIPVDHHQNFSAAFETARQTVAQMKKDGRIIKPVVIEFEAGHYFIDKPVHLTPEDSGTSELPVTFRVKDPENTLFTAGKRLPAFTDAGNGLWKCKVDADWKFEQLFVNGKRAVRARTPNGSFFNLADVKESKTGSAYLQTVQLPKENLTRLPMGSTGLQMVVLHKWDHTRRFISSIDKSNGTIETSGRKMKPWNSWKKGTRVYFENFKEALDQAGEWYLDNEGWLFYKPLAGEKIAATVSYAPVNDKFIIIKGDPAAGKFVEYINFEGFRFMYSSMKTPAGGFEPAQAAAPVEAVCMVDGARNLKFTDIHFQHIGAYGMWFRKGCSDIHVEKCLIEDIGAGGIRIGESSVRKNDQEKTGNITLHNNIIKNGGHIFPCAVGVWIGQSAYNKVTHNDIGHLYYTAVSVGWTWGYRESGSHHNLIINNHLHDIGKGLLSDMGAVYTLGNNPGTVIANNVIHDIDSYSYGGWGLYTDEGSQDIVMENNLVYNTKSGGFHQHYGKNNIIQKNVFANSRLQQIQATRVEDHISFHFKNNVIFYSQGECFAGPWDKIKVGVDNNIYWNSTGSEVTIKGKSFSDWQKSGKDKSSLIADPLFVNPEQNDFQVKENSPALKLNIDFPAFKKAGVIGEDWKTFTF